ncbi:response regulator transcription factor [Sphingomonas sp. SUN039]|uniref:response regulator transcription factor n=1 Tax=Sphingomonas sp. SUN039 TaxID=2937787 RepID=UPI002164981A|nr:helix-turn-helix transcriptional regulator [Sphingomonas sp. SUN039]UVO53050.1 helix-turn-helix transcriptional regulator [Sphingomonas sp. SUN039]
MDDPFESLTERQLECLELASLPMTAKEIARSLSISPKTVEAHLAAAISRLGLANRNEAVRRLRERRAASGEIPRDVTPISYGIPTAPSPETEIPMTVGSELHEPASFRTFEDIWMFKRPSFTGPVKGATRDDLTISDRLVYILISAVFIALCLAAATNLLADTLISLSTTLSKLP